MLIEEQIEERRERAKNAIARILERPSGQLFGDYVVQSFTAKQYRVALRGPGRFDNYCSCPDFAVNTLGTCKHIEALLARLGGKSGAKLRRTRFERTRASLSLHYGDCLAVRLRLPVSPSPELAAVAARYFDADGVLPHECYARFGEVLDALRRVDDQTVVYTDAIDFLDRENELAEGLAFEQRTLATLDKKDPFEGFLNTKLLPYQIRGALFAASRGRVVLADDMGLGKTIQAMAAAEMLRRRKGIQRVLVVAPASVKYQWKSEIGKFTGLTAQIIDGPLAHRRELYAAPAFFNLTSYELVLRDLDLLRELAPDLIILDEAQRIRNWETATAKAVKQLKSRYAIVLTGTPLENKLEELFSVVEFVDGRRLGPAFRFLREHRVEDEKGKLTGYRGLDRIHRQLQPILLRRTRKEVLGQLPPRTDQIFRVEMTREQAGPYEEQSEILSRLIRKWERQRWLSDVDLRRLMICLVNMRMLCNSTFLFDKETNVSPKLEEFREIIRELTVEEDRKVVVFSEWETMTRLAGELLGELGIGFVSLHGGVPGKKRGALMETFRNDPKCRVFLSTDAGGVGLNLQAASAVINFEPPWNPARLEQRIARVHRLGQSRPVQVIHLITADSIEERVWETLQRKKALFAGVFDSPVDEVDFTALGRKTVLEAVKEVATAPPPRVREPEPPPAKPEPARTRTESADVGQAAAGLMEAGLRFLESLVPPAEKPTVAPAIGKAIGSLIQHDPASNKPVLAIPLPESVTAERLGSVLAGLLGRLAK